MGTILVGCEAMVLPIAGETIVQEVSSVEKNCKEVAEKVVSEEERIIKVVVPRNYPQRLQLVREILMPEYEFIIGEDYIMCNLYDAGAFTQKIRIVIISKNKKTIKIWAGNTLGGRILSEDPATAEALAEQIKITLKK